LKWHIFWHAFVNTLLKFNILNLAFSLHTTKFNIKKFYIMLALLSMFCTDLRFKSGFCFIHHYMIGFYDRAGKCLKRGMD